MNMTFHKHVFFEFKTFLGLTNIKHMENVLCLRWSWLCLNHTNQQIQVQHAHHSTILKKPLQFYLMLYISCFI